MFLLTSGECEGTGVDLRMRPIRTQVLRGPSKLCQVCGSTSWVGHVTFMPIFGSFDVTLVTWAVCLILIGREKFCCAVIGWDLLEPLLLLTLIIVNNVYKEFSL